MLLEVIGMSPHLVHCISQTFKQIIMLLGHECPLQTQVDPMALQQPGAQQLFAEHSQTGTLQHLTVKAQEPGGLSNSLRHVNTLEKIPRFQAWPRKF